MEMIFFMLKKIPISQISNAFKDLIFFLWQLIALLLLRHALTITDPDSGDDEDTSTFFSVSGIRMCFYFY